MGNLKKLLVNLYVHIVRCVFGVKNKAVFTSFSGKSYSDNTKVLSEELHKLRPDTEIVWLFQRPEEKKHIVPPYVRCINIKDRKKLFAELATAAVYADNFALPYLPKNKKQMFIQLWHGDKGFKKILHDSPFVNETYFLNEQIPGYCDLCVAGSEYGKMQFTSAFRYKGELLMEGIPRNDILLNPDEKISDKVRSQLGLVASEKVLLYAPTLRREQAKNRTALPIQDLSVSATLDALEKKDGCRWICLLRAHPAMVGLCDAGEDSRIKDASEYEDMAELLLVSDMLITDYSSCAGDFALTGRPIVLYQADIAQYLEKDRTMYFDMKDSPFFVAQSQQELENWIQQLTPEMAKQNCKEIMAFYQDCETGHAGESVAQIVSNWIDRVCD